MYPGFDKDNFLPPALRLNGKDLLTTKAYGVSTFYEGSTAGAGNN
jgi:hypothetical protein